MIDRVRAGTAGRPKGKGMGYTQRAFEKEFPVPNSSFVAVVLF